MQQDLKQRLIGVTIIVALVVIFVPMLFDENPDKVAGNSGIPPIPSNVMETTLDLPKSAEDVAPKEEKPEPESGFRIVPLTDPPAEKPEPESAKTQSQPSAPEELEEGGEEDLAPAREKPAVAADKPAAEVPKKPAAAAAPVADKPIVKPVPEKPAGADIKKPKPAVELPKKPETAGEHPTVAVKPEPAPEAVKKPKPVRPAEPVAVKPELPPVAKPAAPKPAAAVAAPAAKPAEPKPVAAVKPTPPMVAPTPKPAETVSPGADVWVIQAGSFTSEEKAKALAEKLRQSKFPAFIESATSDHGPTYRVQIGPELDRGRAEQIQKQMESSVGIRGIIVPHQ